MFCNVLYCCTSQLLPFRLESLGPLLYLWKWSSAYVYARGRKQCCTPYYCLWRISIKPRLPFSICNVFFVSKSNLLDFILSNWITSLSTYDVIGFKGAVSRDWFKAPVVFLYIVPTATFCALHLCSCVGVVSSMLFVIYANSGDPDQTSHTNITKTRLYSFDPLKPHFHIVKQGFTEVYIIFLISPQKHVLSRNMKNIIIFYLKIFGFWTWNFLYIWIGVFS